MGTSVTSVPGPGNPDLADLASLAFLAEQVRNRQVAGLLERNRAQHADPGRELALQAIVDLAGLAIAARDPEQRRRGIRGHVHVELRFTQGGHDELAADIRIGKPYLDGSKVTGTVQTHGKTRKVPIVKFRRRKHYMRQGTHRQQYTEVKITGISG
mgnify:CR=1 FL=1